MGSIMDMELATDLSSLLQPCIITLLLLLYTTMEREKLSPTHLIRLLLVKQLVEASQALEVNLWFHSDPSQQLIFHTQQSTSDDKSILLFCVYNSCFYEGFTQKWIWHQVDKCFQIFLIETTFLHYWFKQNGKM